MKAKNVNDIKSKMIRLVNIIYDADPDYLRNLLSAEDCKTLLTERVRLPKNLVNLHTTTNRYLPPASTELLLLTHALRFRVFCCLTESKTSLLAYAQMCISIVGNAIYRCWSDSNERLAVVSKMSEEVVKHYSLFNTSGTTKQLIEIGIDFRAKTNGNFFFANPWNVNYVKNYTPEFHFELFEKRLVFEREELLECYTDPRFNIVPVPTTYIEEAPLYDGTPLVGVIKRIYAPLNRYDPGGFVRLLDNVAKSNLDDEAKRRVFMKRLTEMKNQRGFTADDVNALHCLNAQEATKTLLRETYYSAAVLYASPSLLKYLKSNTVFLQARRKYRGDFFVLMHLIRRHEPKMKGKGAVLTRLASAPLTVQFTVMTFLAPFAA